MPDSNNFENLIMILKMALVFMNLAIAHGEWLCFEKSTLLAIQTRSNLIYWRLWKLIQMR